MLDPSELSRAVECDIITRAQTDGLRSLVALPSVPRRRAVTAAEVVLASAFALGLALVPLAAWMSFAREGLAVAGGTYSFAGPGLAVAGAAYSAYLLAVGRLLWRGPYAAAGGVLIAAAALMVPFAVHGLEHAIGFFPQQATPPGDLGEFLADPAFLVDAAAIAALAVAVWRFPFPPLSALLVGAAWVLAMDVAPLAFGDATTWNQRALVSGILGAWAITAGFLLDRRTRGDFAGWLYAAGLFAFCAALLTVETASSAVVVLHVGIGSSLLVVALLLRRPVFAVCGALALAGTAGRVSTEVLDGAPLVSVALGVALAVAAGAAVYGRLERKLEGPLRMLVPPALRRVLPPLPPR